ncbi:MAG TPA: LysR substrate-binding domain-containing protein [Acidobacteriaceae bacterium]|jgi:LysR family hydrogen peroxide-inducible transcriptional activator
MEIHQLRYFCAVVRHGTFTRASEAQHVTQPSLSQQILKLEAELGAPLFDRMPRSAKLTVFGKAFLPKAERILRELEDAKTEMLEMTGEEKGSVVLGVIPTIAAYLLPRILSSFSMQHPLVKIQVIEEITPLILERLHVGSADMAIVALPVQGPELETTELFSERFFAVLPEDHPRAKQKSIRLANLRDEPFLLLKEGHCFRDNLIAACRESRTRPSVAFESGQFSTILAMVSAGMGVSAVPAMAVQPVPDCRFVPIMGKRTMRTIGIVRLRHHFETRAQQALVNHILALTRKRY